MPVASSSFSAASRRVDVVISVHLSKLSIHARYFRADGIGMPAKNVT
jgi:hypothetical protein